MAQIVVTAGIDVSKDRLDISLWPQVSQTRRVGRSELAGLIAWLGEHDVVRIGLEAGGGDEREIVQTLARAGFIVVVVNP